MNPPKSFLYSQSWIETDGLEKGIDLHKIIKRSSLNDDKYNIVIIAIKATRIGDSISAGKVAQPVASCQLVIRSPGAWIHDLEVEEGDSRRGLGGMLLDLAMEIAKQSGSEAISLSVDPKNKAALSLYRKHEFFCAYAREHDGHYCMVKKILE